MNPSQDWAYMLPGPRPRHNNMVLKLKPLLDQVLTFFVSWQSSISQQDNLVSNSIISDTYSVYFICFTCICSLLFNNFQFTSSLLSIYCCALLGVYSLSFLLLWSQHDWAPFQCQNEIWLLKCAGYGLALPIADGQL